MEKVCLNTGSCPQVPVRATGIILADGRGTFPEKGHLKIYGKKDKIIFRKGKQ
jgi:hypothetical protein